MRVDTALGWYGIYLAEEGRKPSTIKTKKAYLKVFIHWLKSQKIKQLNQVDKALMEDYARYLKSVNLKSGQGYRGQTLVGLWGVALALMNALVDAEVITAKSWPEGLMKITRENLRTILSEADTQALLDAIDTSSAIGQRDRALFELIYCAGLRVSEAVRLRWDEVNLETRLALVRQSKFDKDRMVPLTHEAVEMLRRYRGTGSNQGLIFSQRSGKILSSVTVNRRFKALAEAVGVYRRGVCVHQLRHACASHLIAHGAELRYVQELLGHESIQTTVRYTQDQVEAVKRAYRSHHPRENQLYQEVDGQYLDRIEALKALILEGRKGRLAKKAKSV